MLLHPGVKCFIKQNENIIREGNFTKLFYLAAGAGIGHGGIAQLIKCITDIGVDTITYRSEAFEQLFLEKMEVFKKDFDPRFDDSGTARACYILDAISSLGFKHEELIQFLIDNKERLNIKMEPLERAYWWATEQDYNVGWFNKRLYRKYNPDIFG